MVRRKEEGETGERENTQAGPPAPDPALRRLERLVGSWEFTGRTVGSEVDNVFGRHAFKISVSYGPIDATFTAAFGEDGRSFSGGWRPNPGADVTVKVPYDLTGTGVE